MVSCCFAGTCQNFSTKLHRQSRLSGPLLPPTMACSAKPMPMPTSASIDLPVWPKSIVEIFIRRLSRSLARRRLLFSAGRSRPHVAQRYRARHRHTRFPRYPRDKPSIPNATVSWAPHASTIFSCCLVSALQQQRRRASVRMRISLSIVKHATSVTLSGCNFAVFGKRSGNFVGAYLWFFWLDLNDSNGFGIEKTCALRPFRFFALTIHLSFCYFGFL